MANELIQVDAVFRLPALFQAVPDRGRRFWEFFTVNIRNRNTRRAYLPQANVHMMIQRRARSAGLRTKISAHSFRATGITTYLQNGGKLEIAQQMAGHESARTTGLYDRRTDQIALDEVERIAF